MEAAFLLRPWLRVGRGAGHLCTVTAEIRPGAQMLRKAGGRVPERDQEVGRSR